MTVGDALVLCAAIAVGVEALHVHAQRWAKKRAHILVFLFRHGPHEATQVAARLGFRRPPYHTLRMLERDGLIASFELYPGPERFRARGGRNAIAYYVPGPRVPPQ